MQAAFHRWSAFLYQKTYNLLYYKYNVYICKVVQCALMYAL